MGDPRDSEECTALPLILIESLVLASHAFILIQQLFLHTWYRLRSVHIYIYIELTAFFLSRSLLFVFVFVCNLCVCMYVCMRTTIWTDDGDEQLPRSFCFTADMQDFVKVFGLTRDEMLMNQGAPAKEGTAFNLVGFSSGNADAVAEGSVSGKLYPTRGFIYMTERSGVALVIESDKMRSFIETFSFSERLDELVGGAERADVRRGSERDPGSAAAPPDDDEIASAVDNALKILSRRRRQQSAQVHETDATESRSDDGDDEQSVRDAFGEWPTISNAAPTTSFGERTALQDKMNAQHIKEQEARQKRLLSNKAMSSIIDMAARQQQEDAMRASELDSRGGVSAAQPSNPQYGPAPPPPLEGDLLLPLEPSGPSPMSTASFVVDGVEYRGDDYVTFGIDSPQVDFLVRRHKDGKMVLTDTFVYDSEADEYTRAIHGGSEVTVSSAARHYQHIYIQDWVPFTFESFEEDLGLEASANEQYEVTAVYFLPIVSRASEPLKIDLEEVYVLNGETKEIERAEVHGKSAVDPVLVVRDGKLYLEDANEQKSPLELYKEHVEKVEAAEELNNTQKRFMFANLKQETAALDASMRDKEKGGPSVETEVIDIDSLDVEEDTLLKDFDDGPDVPEADLE